MPMGAGNSNPKAIMTVSHTAPDHAAPRRGQIGYVTLIAGFCVAYIAAHYALLVINEVYQPTLLDEIASLGLAPFALYYVISRNEYFLIGLYGIYIAILLAGAVLFDQSGMPQPVSGMVAAALDFKLPIFVFAFAGFFSAIPDAGRVFRLLFISFIVVGLINIPFVAIDYVRGVDIFGGNLGSKGDFILPSGLVRHNTEVAWISCLAALSSLTMFVQKRNILYLSITILFAIVLLSSVSIKEMAAFIAGAFIILRGRDASRFISILAIVVGVLVLAVVVTQTSIGYAIMNHVGMFVGADAIETVRWSMTEVSFQLASEYFPLGAGGGTFGSAPSYQENYSYLYYLYGISTLLGGGPDDAAFLQDVFWAKVVGEAGWFGFAAYVSFLAILMRRIIKSRAAVDRDTDVLLRFCLACGVLLLMISLASSPFTNQFLVFIAGISFGFGCSVAAATRKRRAGLRRFRI